MNEYIALIPLTIILITMVAGAIIITREPKKAKQK